MRFSPPPSGLGLWPGRPLSSHLGIEPRPSPHPLADPGHSCRARPETLLDRSRSRDPPRWSEIWPLTLSPFLLLRSTAFPAGFVLIPFFQLDSQVSVLQFRAEKMLPNIRPSLQTPPPSPLWPLLSGLQPSGLSSAVCSSCSSWKSREGRENLLECRGPREAAHPKGRGAACPSCLLRHIPEMCVLGAVTP